MLSQLLGTIQCGMVDGAPGPSQMIHSHPLCASAAWDGFIFSVLASSNHPRQKSDFVGNAVPHSRDSTSVVFRILHLTRFHFFLHLYFMHLFCNSSAKCCRLQLAIASHKGNKNVSLCTLQDVLYIAKLVRLGNKVNV